MAPINSDPFTRREFVFRCARIALLNMGLAVGGPLLITMSKKEALPGYPTRTPTSGVSGHLDLTTGRVVPNNSSISRRELFNTNNFFIQRFARLFR
jgi:hypothetical protein